jgi:ribosomal protein L23
MSHIFEENGVEPTKETKKDIDLKIHELLGVEYKNCSTTWREVKKRLADDEVGFMADLKKALS